MNTIELISFRKLISTMTTLQLEEQRDLLAERISKMILIPDEVTKLGVVESVLEERKKKNTKQGAALWED